jgi:hypothetical protein
MEGQQIPIILDLKGNIEISFGGGVTLDPEILRLGMEFRHYFQ